MFRAIRRDNLLFKTKNHAKEVEYVSLIIARPGGRTETMLEPSRDRAKLEIDWIAPGLWFVQGHIRGFELSQHLTLLLRYFAGSAICLEYALQMIGFAKWLSDDPPSATAGTKWSQRRSFPENRRA